MGRLHQRHRHCVRGVLALLAQLSLQAAQAYVVQHRAGGRVDPPGPSGRVALEPQHPGLGEVVDQAQGTQPLRHPLGGIVRQAGRLAGRLVRRLAARLVALLVTGVGGVHGSRVPHPRDRATPTDEGGVVSAVTGQT